MSRRAPATSRGATVSRALAKRCNNTCPICWMPLNVGRGVHAEKWERVQMVFKSKPTFSVKEGCTDHSRAVHVFGLNDFTGSKTTNYEACHFLHHSAVGDNQTFSQMWGVGITREDYFVVTSAFGNEPDLKPEFFACLFSRSNGLFNRVFFDVDSSTNKLVEEITKNCPNLPASFDKLKTLINSTFPGCVDCNSKMTILDFIQPLFAMIYPPDTYSSRTEAENYPGSTQEITNTREITRTTTKKGFNNEMMLHYIMLCGLSKTENRKNIEGSAYPMYEFKPPEAKRSWQLKCIIMWCSLQILFCDWKMAKLFKGVLHHSNYIYRGVQDFYISLWFYSMYVMSAKERIPLLEFDEFHYYYTSMLPFFYVQHGPSYNGKFNLGSLVLDETNIGKFTLPDDTARHLDAVETKIGEICNAVATCWNQHMKDICAKIHVVHGFGVPPPLVLDYFTPYDWIKQHSRRIIEDSTPLDLQTFCTLLTPQLYWFHFKYITLPNITQTSTEYLHTPHMPPTAHLMWFNWCRNFDIMTHQLSVRFHMEQKAARIRLRMM